jgi:hypothetical protein
VAESFKGQSLPRPIISYTMSNGAVAFGEYATLAMHSLVPLLTAWRTVSRHIEPNCKIHSIGEFVGFRSLEVYYPPSDRNIPTTDIDVSARSSITGTEWIANNDNPRP